MEAVSFFCNVMPRLCQVTHIWIFQYLLNFANLLHNQA
jgi:hypothetical protein